MNQNINEIIIRTYLEKEFFISNPLESVTDYLLLNDKITNKENYNKIIKNINYLQFPKFIISHTDYFIAIGYIKNGADKSGISNEERKVLKEYARSISALCNFSSIQDAYFANLYSTPINHESIHKINNSIMKLLMSTSMENYDIGKSLGRNMTYIHAQNWLFKRHLRVGTEINALLGMAPNKNEKEIVIGMVHYCFYANRSTYKSKISIAKKIYNFRVNSLKIKTFNDNSTSVRLQIEVHHETMEIIKNFADKENLKMRDAIHRLVLNGILSIKHGPGVIKYTN